METRLQHARRQREIYFAKLKRRNDSVAQPVVETEMRLDEEDMRNIYNEWRHSPEDWMSSTTLEE